MLPALRGSTSAEGSIAHGAGSRAEFRALRPGASVILLSAISRCSDVLRLSAGVPPTIPAAAGKQQLGAGDEKHGSGDCRYSQPAPQIEEVHSHLPYRRLSTLQNVTARSLAGVTHSRRHQSLFGPEYDFLDTVETIYLTHASFNSYDRS